ncbi:hypothetical protein [Novosphingobium sp. THN1]|nr:hypothetical protein [Novosphingobium sp. THN1]
MRLLPHAGNDRDDILGHHAHAFDDPPERRAGLADKEHARAYLFA